MNINDSIQTAAALLRFLNEGGSFSICNVRQMGRTFTHVIWIQNGGAGGYYEKRWAGEETCKMLEDAAAYALACIGQTAERSN